MKAVSPPSLPCPVVGERRTWRLGSGAEGRGGVVVEEMLRKGNGEVSRVNTASTRDTFLRTAVKLPPETK